MQALESLNDSQVREGRKAREGEKVSRKKRVRVVVVVGKDGGNGRESSNVYIRDSRLVLLHVHTGSASYEDSKGPTYCR